MGSATATATATDGGDGNGNGNATPLPPPATTAQNVHDKSPTTTASTQPLTTTSEPQDEPTSYSTQALLQRSDSQATQDLGASQLNGSTNGGDKELPRLQANAPLENGDQLQPVLDDDPLSFNLVAPPNFEHSEPFSLESQATALFSKGHLQVIFSDPAFLFRFTSFLSTQRHQSVPVLVHYLDSLKSLRAIHYANAICDGLDPVEGLPFTQKPVKPTINTFLEDRAARAFDVLVSEELPAYITHEYIQIVSASITARVTGALSPRLRELSDGLAEVFCLTDPSRPDNPIIFASEEFNRTTQYGLSYVLGRNCRFLQGPMTNPHSVRRLREAIKAGKQHQEVLLNYRRDGSPFVNLLMTAPLADSRGVIRYNIGAQVDVSGLVKDCAEMESLQRLMDLRAQGEDPPVPEKPNPQKNDELQELSEMLNQGELNIIRKHGGRMHKEVVEEDLESVTSQQPRLLLKDPVARTSPMERINGRLSGVYQNFLLVRPYPSLRILFASPTQRLPGILQSPFLNKIGGSNRVREELTAAFAEGRGVTAKVRWVTKGDDHGKNKWIHCTPLVGAQSQIGVWMVVIVDDDKALDRWSGSGRAPPQVGTTERSWNSSNGHNSGDYSQRGSREGNGSYVRGYAGDGAASASGNGSVTSLRIG